MPFGEIIRIVKLIHNRQIARLTLRRSELCARHDIPVIKIDKPECYRSGFHRDRLARLDLYILLDIACVRKQPPLLIILRHPVGFHRGITRKSELGNPRGIIAFHQHIHHRTSVQIERNTVFNRVVAVAVAVFVGICHICCDNRRAEYILGYKYKRVNSVNKLGKAVFHIFIAVAFGQLRCLNRALGLLYEIRLAKPRFYAYGGGA